DIAPAFARFAQESEERRPLWIGYCAASGMELPFAAECFDFVTAWMALMDMPRHDLALRECHRVVRRGGFLQFSILHPCFSPPHRRLLRRDGEAYAVEVGRYFDRVDGQVDRWLFSAAPAAAKAGLAPFEVPIFHRTLSE